MNNSKIPKGYSETIYRRRSDNATAKRKAIKGQTTIYKTLYTENQRLSNKKLTKDRRWTQTVGQAVAAALVTPVVSSTDEK